LRLFLLVCLLLLLKKTVFVRRSRVDDNPPLSFFLPLENKSEWFLRALFLCCCCCFENRNCRETEKILQKNKKEEKHFLKHSGLKLFTILL